MKLQDLFETFDIPNIAEIDDEEVEQLRAFFEIASKSLKLKPDSFRVGTISEMVSRKYGTIKCQANFHGNFVTPPSLFTVKLIPKLMTLLAKKHLPGWEFMFASIYSKTDPVGKYHIEDYLQQVAPTLTTDELPENSEISVYLKAPAKYQT